VLLTTSLSDIPKHHTKQFASRITATLCQLEYPPVKSAEINWPIKFCIL